MKNLKKPITFILFLGLTILALSLLQVVVSNRLSTTGVTLGNLQDEIASYKTENTILSQKLLETTSLHSIASQAAQLGFSETKAHLVLSSPLPIAKKQ